MRPKDTGTRPGTVAHLWHRILDFFLAGKPGLGIGSCSYQQHRRDPGLTTKHPRRRHNLVLVQCAQFGFGDWRIQAPDRSNSGHHLEMARFCLSTSPLNEKTTTHITKAYLRFGQVYIERGWPIVKTISIIRITHSIWMNKPQYFPMVCISMPTSNVNVPLCFHIRSNVTETERLVNTHHLRLTSPPIRKPSTSPVITKKSTSLGPLLLTWFTPVIVKIHSL